MATLKEVLCQDDTVLFIGSGISRWSGLPTWAGMIENLAEYVDHHGGSSELIRVEARKGDFLQAASYGFDKLSKMQIGEFIRQASKYGTAKPHDIHKKIVNLGPRAFITTNYDDLIEQSLRKWRQDEFCPAPVTNRNLTELAGIVQARANSFIFKPHGDAGDSESIILTREQYRLLLAQGERHAALDSLTMLLASRPVVYLGFSLRDPDFNYIRDLLANTYRNGIRDHFAIMADVTEPEIDYWRRNYGIHLVSYSTFEGSDKSRDHSSILKLLDDLATPAIPSPRPDSFDPKSPNTLLTLTRYAAGLARFPKLPSEMAIRVVARDDDRLNNRWFDRSEFDGQKVQTFLMHDPQRACLIGLPGAGKSYALRRAASEIAINLSDACIMDKFDPKVNTIPLLVDMKHYAGNIFRLIDETLPKSIGFNELLQHFKIKIFIDSFNEMPREYLENGSYEQDFESFIQLTKNASLIVSSRTDDGIDNLGLTTFSLDLIDSDVITSELRKLNIEIEDHLEQDIQDILQRPFFFQLVATQKVKLPANAKPHDLHRSYVQTIQQAFADQFGDGFQLTTALLATAYRSLDRGEEVFPLSDLLVNLKSSIKSSGFRGVDEQQVANWLVSQNVMIPYARSRISFVHQSITEYLAASQLAKEYSLNPLIISEKLSLTRWDQALFFTLSFLSEDLKARFTDDILGADLFLAVNAAKFLEFGRDQIVSRILDEFIALKNPDHFGNFRATHSLEMLPITTSHEMKLRSLLARGGMLGGQAALLLIRLYGANIKEEMRQTLIERPNDYNFCVRVGRALQEFADVDDVEQISVWTKALFDTNQHLESAHDEIFTGFLVGAEELLAKMDLAAIRKLMPDSNNLSASSKFRASLVSRIAREIESKESFDLLCELQIAGYEESTFPLLMLMKYGKGADELWWTSFTVAHVDKLLEFTDNEPWALEVLELMCAARPDLSKIVERRANQLSGIKRALLLTSVSPGDQSELFKSLSALTKYTATDLDKIVFEVLQRIEIDWSAKEETLVKLLELHNPVLTKALLHGSIPVQMKNLGKIEIGPIVNWLSWLNEYVPLEEVGWWLIEQMGSLFGQHLDQNVRMEFIVEFNKPNSQYRRILLIILPHFEGISIEDFEEEAISFMLADLGKKQTTADRDILLGKLASDRFVLERLLPIVPKADAILLENLVGVINSAGRRLGKRYLLDSSLNLEVSGRKAP